AWVNRVLRWRWLTIMLFVAVAGGGTVYTYHELGIQTDTTDMISPELSWRRDYMAYRERFPARDRNLLVVVESAVADAAERYAADLAARLDAAPQHFEAAYFPARDPFFLRHGLLYLEEPALLALGDRLALAQPLLGRL